MHATPGLRRLDERGRNPLPLVRLGGDDRVDEEPPLAQIAVAVEPSRILRKLNARLEVPGDFAVDVGHEGERRRLRQPVDVAVQPLGEALLVGRGEVLRREARVVDARLDAQARDAVSILGVSLAEHDPAHANQSRSTRRRGQVLKT